jgi:hypothetical protein
MQQNIQQGMLCCKSLQNLISTQNTKNLISGQDEEMETVQKETPCHANREASRGHQSSTKKGCLTLFLLVISFSDRPPG